MDLTPIPSGCEDMDRNFVEVKTSGRGHSEGTPLSARDLSEKLVILLHDKHRHRGCLAPCDGKTRIFDTVSALRHYMVNQWGSRPDDVDVLLAGGMINTAEFNHNLKKHFKRLGIKGRVFDARNKPIKPIGQVPRGAPANHLFYYPTTARVELVTEADEPGGRAYQTQGEDVTLQQAV